MSLVQQEETNWDQSQVDLLRRTIAKGCDDDEFALFVRICKHTGLDPFTRQIYAIPRWDYKAGRNVMTTQCSIDGFRLVAQRSQEYAGQVGPQWCGEDGEWTDVWLSQQNPSAARVGVLRATFNEPVWGVATWAEFCPINKKTGLPSGLWGNMPSVMLAKCAESQALRKAFPAELSGLYTAEEMSQATPVPQKAPAKDGATPAQKTLLTELMSKLEMEREAMLQIARDVCENDAINGAADLTEVEAYRLIQELETYLPGDEVVDAEIVEDAPADDGDV